MSEPAGVNGVGLTEMGGAVSVECMTLFADAVDQLADEIETRILGSLAVLGWLDVAEQIRPRVYPAAQRLVSQLAQDGDDQLAAQTVTDLAGVLWDVDPEPEWWRTPVGRLAGRSIGREDAEAVTQSVAAAMLGVARGTVAQLVHRGTLARHPEGGVSRASVLARIDRLAGCVDPQSDCDGG